MLVRMFSGFYLYFISDMLSNLSQALVHTRSICGNLLFNIFLTGAEHYQESYYLHCMYADWSEKWTQLYKFWLFSSTFANLHCKDISTHKKDCHKSFWLVEISFFFDSLRRWVSDAHLFTLLSSCILFPCFYFFSTLQILFVYIVRKWNPCS